MSGIVFKTVVFIIFKIIVIGLLMKAAHYVCKRIGIYKILKDYGGNRE